jgi:hypothetical protein
MSANEVHSYAYVNRPYERIAPVLKLDAIGVFQRATASAKVRANALLSTIRANVGPLELGADVVVRVTGVEETREGPLGAATRLLLEWHATPRAELFPTMKATLSAYALTPGETQIELRGAYVPPLGVVGAAFDKVVGHRIADAAVQRFVEEIAERLRVDVASG